MVKNLVQLLHAAYEAKVLVFVHGTPGIGKTSLIRGLGEALGFDVEIVIGSRLDRTDLGGIPVLKDGQVLLAPPPFVRRVLESLERGRQVVIFFDELHDTPPEVFPALLQGLLEGNFAGIKLPVWRVAAGNPPEQNISGRGLPPAAANRGIHFELGIDAPFLARGFLSGGDFSFVRNFLNVNAWSEERYQSKLREMFRIFGIYLERRGERVFRYPESYEEAGGAWPSPRSWELGLRVAAAAYTLGYGDAVAFKAIEGAVGVGAASEFIRFLQELDLPDPRELIERPELLPEKDDAAYAALLSVSDLAIKEFPALHDAFYALLRFAADRGQVDIAASAASIYHQHYFAKAAERQDLPPITREHLGPRLQKVGEINLRRKLK